MGWERVERLVEMKDAVKMYKLLTKELGPPAIRSMFVARSAVSHRSTRSTEAGCRGAGWSAPSTRSDTAPRQHGMICRLMLPAAHLYELLSALFVSLYMCSFFVFRACAMLF